MQITLRTQTIKYQHLPLASLPSNCLLARVACKGVSNDTTATPDERPLRSYFKNEKRISGSVSLSSSVIWARSESDPNHPQALSGPCERNKNPGRRWWGVFEFGIIVPWSKAREWACLFVRKWTEKGFKALSCYERHKIPTTKSLGVIS